MQITIYPSLTKEDFWDKINKSYPIAMQYFNKWIDTYKKSVGWEVLMSDDIKFHDLPIELQMGIVARFCIEEIEHVNFADFANNVKEDTILLFSKLEEATEKKK